MNVWLVGAGYGQANRFGSGRKQQPVVRNPSFISEDDLAGPQIDVNGLHIETQVDVVF